MKFYPLALLALLLVASPANAGGRHNYSYGSCLAPCATSAHSWKNGCCDREPSCCDHVWDGYCSDRCCGAYLPVPIINWNSLHSHAGPYQVPCLRLPHWHKPCAGGCAVPLPPPPCTESCGTCDSGCGSCGSACGCNLFDWLHRTFHRAPSACGCDLGCSDCDSCGSSMNYAATTPQASDEKNEPTKARPLPVAPNSDALPMPAESDMEMPMEIEMDMPETKSAKSNNKTAGLWLFSSTAS